MNPTVVVIGGGLAGLAAALDAADAGARVTVLERRNHLGGLTWSFRHGDHWVDNGQHVFLRCCDQYRWLLDRIGATGDVQIQDRLDIPVVAPPVGPDGHPIAGRLARWNLPAPLHLGPSLLGFPHLSWADRLRLGPAVLGLRRLDLADPALDDQTFGDWLARHGQSPAAIACLWDLITVPTVNLAAAEASLAMAAKVFQTGLLTDRAAADIGWSRVPLGQLHGDRGAVALARAGVEVRLGVAADRVLLDGDDGFSVSGPDLQLTADGVVVAVPHDRAARLLPGGSVAFQERLDQLGFSAVMDVHLIYDRPVSPWPLMAGLRSPVQWVFDRTAAAGLAGTGCQYLAVSVSNADALLGRHPTEIVAEVSTALAALLPDVAGARARLVDSLVTKERQATFRAVPGTAALRPPAATAHPGLAVAGAWTDTGWPATMEGAVRSGRAATRAVLAGVVSTRHGAGSSPARTRTPRTEEVA
jgi:squalene-associated FAD-dependent desaturase